MKKVLIIFGKVSAVILIAFVLLEIGLRLFPKVIPVKLLVEFREELRADIAQRLDLMTIHDTVVLDRNDGGPLVRIFRPSTKVTFKIEDLGAVRTVVMDKIGFCNPPQNDYDMQTIDIITLGDSFTWCQSVSPEETWTSQLSFRLGRSTYNLGRQGIGPYEYLQIFRRFGVQKSPRIVIMNIYAGNDLRDAVQYQLYRDAAAKGQRSPGLPPSPCTTMPRHWCRLCSLLQSGPMGRYSYAFNLAVAAADSIRGRTVKRLSRFRSVLGEDDLKPNFHYRVILSRDVIFNSSNTDGDEVKHARCLRNHEINLEVFTGSLRAFVELSRQHGFVPVVTFTPSAHTAYDASVVFDDPALGDLMPQFHREQGDFLKTKGRELGYVFIDLTSSLQTAARSNNADLLYYPSSLHLTPRGHAVVAEALTTAMENLGFASTARPGAIKTSKGRRDSE